jgi:hypothetical protein
MDFFSSAKESVCVRVMKKRNVVLLALLIYYFDYFLLLLGNLVAYK